MRNAAAACTNKGCKQAKTRPELRPAKAGPPPSMNRKDGSLGVQQESAGTQPQSWAKCTYCAVWWPSLLCWCTTCTAAAGTSRNKWTAGATTEAATHQTLHKHVAAAHAAMLHCLC